MRLKKATPRYRLISVVLAAVLVFTLVVPGLTEHQWSNKILSFERNNPVYDETVEVETARDELHLPDTLRAIVGIPEEMDVSTFKQAAPEADTSDGSTSYDYYWYGYVAPRNADALVAAGEKAIYTIYYADGELAYRLYGSIEGSENLWFACDEAGNITGAVLDIPVKWSGSYNGDTEGTYTFTASVSSESPYHWSGSAPKAHIYVTESVADNHGEETSCTCGAQPDENGVTAHAEDCPDYTAAETDSDTYDVSETDSETYTAAETDSDTYAAPEAVILTDCHCSPEGEAVAADNYPWAHQEDCKYFSPIECMCREQVAVEVEDFSEEGVCIGSHTEYVSGDFSHVHDNTNRSCPLYGKDTVRVVKRNTGEETVMSVEDAERLVAYQTAHSAENDSAQESAMYPALGCISLVEGSEQEGMGDVRLMSKNGGGGVWDAKGDAAMRKVAPTSGNKRGWLATDEEVIKYLEANPTLGYGDIYDLGVSSAWRDYVCTIWHNKIQTQFAWTPHDETGTDFAWEGGIANTNSSSGGSIFENPLRIPTRGKNLSGENVWVVCSGEQLLYALQNYQSDDIIRLGQNIDLNGMNYNWVGVSRKYAPVTIDGIGHTIYNYGSVADTETTTNQAPHFLTMTGLSGNVSKNVTIKNITFASAKIVQPYVSSGGLFSYLYGYGSTLTLTDIKLKGCLNMSGVTNSKLNNIGAPSASSILGNLCGGADNSGYDRLTARRVFFLDNVIFGKNHVSLGFLSIYNADVQYCASVGGLLVGTGGHSGGFHPCLANAVKIQKSFISAEMYGARMVYGFGGAASCYDCFATGKLEGYEDLSGFGQGYRRNGGAQVETDEVRNVVRCYSTVLVGLRTEARNMAGFSMGTYGRYADCYAAGEVGSHTTPLKETTLTVEQQGLNKVGGFGGEIDATGSFTNCYYDKQTTGMRENALWNWKTHAGIKGLLTSTSDKGGTGMAAGVSFGLGTTNWTYEAGHYPQLKAFSEATQEDWGRNNDLLVKAVSKASTATVFLNTWDNGYDWDNYGVRSASLVSYNRDVAEGTLHKAGKYTYDTVREIVSPFTVTDGTWEELIEGGAKTKMQLVGALAGSESKNIVIEDGKGTVQGPGMNWFSVSNTYTEGSRSVTASRPIRLTGYMSIDAGNDRTLSENNAVEDGRHYDHRKGVTLTMMDDITENLVVGIDNDKFWSTAKRAGYPTVSDTDNTLSTGFYGVPTDHENHLKTRFSASIGAILNTEIWRVTKDASGNYVKNADESYKTQYSVKVTGEGTSGGNPTATRTKDEQKWTGATPFSVDEKQMYVVSYYWQLGDGRYVTDEKLVEIVPSARYLQVDVKGTDDQPNAAALQVNAYQGSTTTVSADGTRSSVITENIPTNNLSTAVWKQKNQYSTLKKLSIQMLDNEGATQGSVTVDEETINKVTPDSPQEIQIPIKFYYTKDVEQTSGTQRLREESLDATALVSYNLCKGSDGGYYIQFNRSCGLSGSAADGTVVPAEGEDLTGLKFGAMHYNVRVAIVVEELAYLRVKQVVDNYTSAMADQPFTAELSGAAVTQVNLKNNETSKIIKVPISGNNDVTISNLLPMEFALQGMTISSTNGAATLSGDVLTLHAGDDVTVTVTHHYSGEGYFKSRAQKYNTFVPAS